jgi:peptidoglycan/xylan/chitin deacetylase (PgdA/CDA1 family)
MLSRLSVVGAIMGLCLSVQPAVDAAGPVEVAKADFSLWPHAIESRTAFDAASRAELLVSALSLESFLESTPAPADLGVKQIRADSLRTWTETAKREWLRSFRAASGTCDSGALACGFRGSTWNELMAFAKRFEAEQASGASYAPWLQNSRAFYGAYLKEQLRLAALFPHPTSEIMALDDSEILGDGLPDGRFALSLDDGPTAAGGYTDRYAALLAEHGISAFFFALGQALEQRIKSGSGMPLKTVYARQCLGSHGFEHKPHAQWREWKSSLENTRGLVRQIFPEQQKVMFRPPYGQRHIELVRFIDSQGSKVVLWNIDSQDWNGKIAKGDVSARVKKLMLLKRRGILLFHDVHDKGLAAIPDILRFADKSGLAWTDCHSLE